MKSVISPRASRICTLSGKHIFPLNFLVSVFFSKALMHFGSGLMRWQGCVQCLHIQTKPVAFNVRAKKRHNILYNVYYSFPICFWGLSLSSDLLHVKVYDCCTHPGWPVLPVCPPSTRMAAWVVTCWNPVSSATIGGDFRSVSLLTLDPVAPWCHRPTTATSELAG